jgi:hypothetical protein
MTALKPLSKTKINTLLSKHSLKVIQYFMNTSIFAQPEVKENENNIVFILVFSF